MAKILISDPIDALFRKLDLCLVPDVRIWLAVFLAGFHLKLNSKQIGKLICAAAATGF